MPETKEQNTRRYILGAVDRAEQRSVLTIGEVVLLLQEIDRLRAELDEVKTWYVKHVQKRRSVSVEKQE